ncbi:MAG TPA: exosortase/archaeosortase family protein [Candidatus Acidoferrum sp.]|nr:exosortase/archaeosortase family protein [Candidatus Acidoferrum sp.]
MRALPVISFIPAFSILYILYPASFEATWKGRTFYLFFMWLVCLELILNWDKIQKPKVNRTRSVRTVLFIAVLVLPTVYVIASNYLGINDALVNLATKYNVDPTLVGWVPLSTEYLVLTVFFVLTVYLGFGARSLKDFALPAIFLAAIGMMYTIDNFFPNGTFTPFQLPVPITTQLAADVLNLMGHATRITETTGTPDGWLSILHVIDPKTGLDIISPPIAIAWPCAGVESLIIYTITILVFLQGSTISWTRRAIYFVFGAVVTFFINVLRIVTLFTIALQYGDQSSQFNDFHFYYGQLYSITWIMLYPLIIIGGQFLSNWFKARANGRILLNSKDLSLAN